MVANLRFTQDFRTLGKLEHDFRLFLQERGFGVVKNLLLYAPTLDIGANKEKMGVIGAPVMAFLNFNSQNENIMVMATLHDQLFHDVRLCVDFIEKDPLTTPAMVHTVYSTSE